jgi:Transposase Tn5 dimerisation domain/Transposase DNA-binding
VGLDARVKTGNVVSWAEEEMGGAELGDARRSRRLVRLVERLGEQPSLSIPAACCGAGETKAAYRLLSHDAVGWDDILGPHLKNSLQRMHAEPVVLCLQDTAELNFNGQDIEGLGPLSYEAQRGMYLHTTYAVTPQRVPLGALNAWMWARQAKNADGTRAGMLESTRWVEGYERLAELAAQLPVTKLVCVGDRESDMLELLLKARDLGHPVDYVLRCQHNRVLPEGSKLWDAVMGSEPLGRIRFEMPAGRGRPARGVEQELRVQRVKLRDRRGGHVELTCLIASEVNTPAGAKPVVWRLLSNRVVCTLEQAVELVNWYRARWEVELLFLTLKEGCRVEALQLGSMQRIERALAVYLVVAWRIGLLMRLGRACPDWDAERLLSREEWQAAWIVARKKPPPTTPTLRAALHMIARLGGFLGRKGDGEPGVKSLWTGLQRVASCVEGMRFQQKCG